MVYRKFWFADYEAHLVKAWLGITIRSLLLVTNGIPSPFYQSCSPIKCPSFKWVATVFDLRPITHVHLKMYALSLQAITSRLNRNVLVWTRKAGTESSHNWFFFDFSCKTTQGSVFFQHQFQYDTFKFKDTLRNFIHEYHRWYKTRQKQHFQTNESILMKLHWNRTFITTLYMVRLFYLEQPAGSPYNLTLANFY